MKVFKILFFFLFNTMAWGYENHHLFNPSFRSQNSKNVISQAKKHFRFIFNQIKKILVDSKSKEIIFDKNKFSQVTNQKEQINYAFRCHKIASKENYQNIKNWVQDNQEYFLNYFTSRANHLEWIETELNSNSDNNDRDKNFENCISHFDLALSFDIKSPEIFECLDLILKQKETNAPELFLLKFILLRLTELGVTKMTELGVTKNHLKAHKIIKKYFLEKFDDYFLIIGNKNVPQWNTQRNLSALMLAKALKKSNPKDWKKKNWVKKAFQEYKSSFKVETPPNALKDQKNWVSNDLFPQVCELYLWQNLQSKKISLFNEVFSESHLKILENCVQNQDQFEDVARAVYLLFHKPLRPAVEQWIENLKHQYNEKKLVNHLVKMSFFEALLF